MKTAAETKGMLKNVFGGHTLGLLMNKYFVWLCSCVRTMKNCDCIHYLMAKTGQFT